MGEPGGWAGLESGGLGWIWGGFSLGNWAGLAGLSGTGQGWAGKG